MNTMGTMGPALWILTTVTLTHSLDIARRVLNPAHNDLICSTWGNFHYKTFDGDIYQFPGRCNYLFASNCKDSLEDFNIQIRHSVGANKTLVSYVVVKIEGLVFEMKKHMITVGAKQITPPYSQSGVQIQQSDLYLKVTSKLGVELLWDEDSLMVKIPSKYMNRTCGLCGNMNGVQQDDFVVKNIKLSPVQFGNLQKLDGPTELCEDMMPPVHNNCSGLMETCVLMLSNKAFSGCEQHLPYDQYIESCVSDLCSCRSSSDVSCLCDTLSEYSRQCAHAGGKPGNWRTKNKCERTCPKNLTYNECGSPCADTCSNSERKHVCEEHCMAGCFCPPGTVLDDVDNRGCIPLSECSCTYNNKRYAPGEFYTNHRNNCTCQGGQWSCNALPCAGRCSLEGGSHIYTYDGGHYNFHGDCSYIFTKDCNGNRFTVLAELKKCGLTDTETCLKSVTLSLDKGLAVVTVKSSGTVLLNGAYSPLPLITEHLAVFQPSSFYLIIQTFSGIQIQVQLSPIMQMSVSLDPEYQGDTCGLCGDFNNIRTDDFRSISGALEGTAAAFANTWKSQADCKDMKDCYENPCSLSVENERFAQYWCSELSKSSGNFALCHASVNPAVYQKNCMYDSCNNEKSEDSVCAALSAYVQACAAEGVTLVGWRRGTICDKFTKNCPRNSTYQYSIRKCQKTCHSLSEPDPSCSFHFSPLDGCTCPNGTFLDEYGACVSAKNCPCYYKGSMTPPGEVVYDNGAMCTCQNGRLQCTGKPPNVAECPANMVYVDCSKPLVGAKGAECQKTCHNLDMECFSIQCASGCVCPKGLVLSNNGSCIPKEECPCLHNGAIYQNGESIQQDCNTCICKDRKWQCTKKKCHRTCAVYGEGHYRTFDGKHFDFSGDCEYTLTQDYCASNIGNGSFRVITENIPCGTTGTTCSKAIKVFLGNFELKLSEGSFEVVERDIGVEVPYQIRQMGIYMVIETKNGLILMWDRKTSIIIKLSPVYKGNVCGLCGNYDGSVSNDFTTRSQSVVVSIEEFGNSWKASPSCPDAQPIRDPCIANPYRQAWSQKHCSIIMGSVFSKCHSKVDPTSYHETCVRDTCACDSGGDCECYCTAVAAYAAACSQAGICVSWRTPDICPLFCDYYNPEGECEWHYKPCGAPCLKTCRNPSGQCMNQLPGLEGCYAKCPKERPFFDEDIMKCVAQADCGCYDDDGKRYNVGDRVPSYMNCETCKCTKKGRHCQTDHKACYCYYGNMKYNFGDIVYNTTDGIGGCITATCSSNGNITRSVDNCLPTTKAPSTTFSFDKTTKHVENVSSPAPASLTSVSCLKEVCKWSVWYDVTCPKYGANDGDFETFQNIREKGHTICKVPSKVECRAQKFPKIPIADLGQVIQCNTSTGLVCHNQDQFSQLCFNYEIRILCCSYVPCGESSNPTTFSPIASSPLITKVPTKTAMTSSVPSKYTVSRSSHVSTSAKSSTVKPQTTGTKPYQPTSKSHAITLTTPCRKQKCSWTTWYDVHFPSIVTSDGDFETLENIRAAGNSICLKPDDIECKAERFPDKNIMQIGQVVTCNTTHGLVCNNRDQDWKFPLCYNYKVRILCCSLEDCASSATSVHSTSKYQTTGHPKETITKTTIRPSSKTTMTSRTVTNTSHKDHTSQTMTISSGISKTTAGKTATAFTTTVKTACKPVCQWSQWFDVSFPNSDTNGDFETYEDIRNSGFKICQEPSKVQCRAADLPQISIKELQQNVHCNNSYGLVCRNEEQIGPFPYCYNYEIRVLCCSDCALTEPTTTDLHTSKNRVTIFKSTSNKPKTTKATSAKISTASYKSTESDHEGTTSNKPTLIKTTKASTESGKSSLKSTPSKPTTTKVTSAKISTATLKSPTESEHERTSYSRSTILKTTKMSTYSVELTSAFKSTSIKPTTTKATTARVSTASHKSTTESKHEGTSSHGSTLTKTTKTTTESVELTSALKMSSSKPTTTKGTSTKVSTASLKSTTESEHKGTTLVKTTTPCKLTTTKSTASKISTVLNKSTKVSEQEGTTTQGSTFTKITKVSSEVSMSSANKFTTPKPAVTKTTKVSTSEKTPSISLKSTPNREELSSQQPKSTKLSTISGKTNTQSSVTKTSHAESFSTERCMCNVNGVLISPGKVLYNTTDDAGWCFYARCSENCQVERFNENCQNSTAPTISSSTKSGYTLKASTTTARTSKAASTAKTSKATTKTLKTSQTKASVTPISTINTPSSGCSALIPPRKVNETWMIDRCTHATCIGPNNIAINKKQCAPVKDVVCANRLPPKNTYDESGCCFQKECECVCGGWGTSHHITFDGTYYGFNGQCTYVLVQQITPVFDHFRVYIDNFSCDPDDPSCVKTLRIMYKSDTIVLTSQSLRKRVTNKIYINEKRAYPSVFQNGMTITSSGIFIIVEIPEIGAYISFNVLSFTVKLPVSKFSGNTEGHCGKCSNNRVDDCILPNGQLASSCNEMAGQWGVPGQDSSSCSSQITTHAPTSTSLRTLPYTSASSTYISTVLSSQPQTLSTKAPSTELYSLPSTFSTSVDTTQNPCDTPEVCNVILSSVFAECHKVVPPEPFFQACVSDGCIKTEGEVLCSNLQMYARFCAIEGVCIDWRGSTDGLCSMNCSQHLVYQACGPAIEPTCNSKYNEAFNNSKEEFVEGCYCPEGTTRFNTISDKCVSTCGCTGPDGMAREPGETWESNCKTCLCDNATMSVKCVARSCTKPIPKPCTEDGSFPVSVPDPTNPCCQVTECRCHISLCSSVKRVCKAGYEAVPEMNAGGCCPKYTCVPKDVCVHNGSEYQPGGVILTSNPCEKCMCEGTMNETSGLYSISCTPIVCNSKCAKGFMYNEIPGQCCGTCVQTQCIVDLADNSTYLLKPGNIWSPPGDNCTEYACVKKKDKLLAVASKMTCPKINLDDCVPETLQKDSKGCCLTCVRESRKCQIVKKEQIVLQNGCKSLKPIVMSSCKGSCESYSMYSAESQSIEQKCSCCKEMKTELVTVNLSCPDGKILKYNFTNVRSCSCADSICKNKIHKGHSPQDPKGQSDTESSESVSEEKHKKRPGLNLIDKVVKTIKQAVDTKSHGLKNSKESEFDKISSEEKHNTHLNSKENSKKTKDDNSSKEKQGKKSNATKRIKNESSSEEKHGPTLVSKTIDKVISTSKLLLGKDTHQTTITTNKEKVKPKNNSAEEKEKTRPLLQAVSSAVKTVKQGIDMKIQDSENNKKYPQEIGKPGRTISEEKQYLENNKKSEPKKGSKQEKNSSEEKQVTKSTAKITEVIKNTKGSGSNKATANSKNKSNSEETGGSRLISHSADKVASTAKQSMDNRASKQYNYKQATENVNQESNNTNVKPGFKSKLPVIDNVVKTVKQAVDIKGQDLGNNKKSEPQKSGESDRNISEEKHVTKSSPKVTEKVIKTTKKSGSNKANANDKNGSSSEETVVSRLIPQSSDKVATTAKQYMNDNKTPKHLNDKQATENVKLKNNDTDAKHGLKPIQAVIDHVEKTVKQAVKTKGQDLGNKKHEPLISVESEKNSSEEKQVSKSASKITEKVLKTTKEPGSNKATANGKNGSNPQETGGSRLISQISDKLTPTAKQSMDDKTPKKSNDKQKTEHGKQESSNTETKPGLKPILPVIDSVVKTVKQAIDIKGQDLGNNKKPEPQKSVVSKENNSEEKQITKSAPKLIEKGIKTTKESGSSKANANGKNGSSSEETGVSRLISQISDRVVPTAKQSMDDKTPKQSNVKQATENLKQESNDKDKKTGLKPILPVIDSAVKTVKQSVDIKGQDLGNNKKPEPQKSGISEENNSEEKQVTKSAPKITENGIKTTKESGSNKANAKGKNGSSSEETGVSRLISQSSDRVVPTAKQSMDDKTPKQSNVKQATENLKQESNNIDTKLGLKPILPVIDSVVKTVKQAIDIKGQDLGNNKKPEPQKNVVSKENSEEKQITKSAPKITEKGIKTTKDSGSNKANANGKNGSSSEETGGSRLISQSSDRVVPTAKQSMDDKIPKQSNDKQATEHVKQESNNAETKPGLKPILPVIDSVVKTVKQAIDIKGQDLGNNKKPEPQKSVVSKENNSEEKQITKLAPEIKEKGIKTTKESGSNKANSKGKNGSSSEETGGSRLISQISDRAVPTAKQSMDDKTPKQSNDKQATENLKQGSNDIDTKPGLKPILPVIDSVVKTVKQAIDIKGQDLGINKISEPPKSVQSEKNSSEEKQVNKSAPKITEKDIKTSKESGSNKAPTNSKNEGNSQETAGPRLKAQIPDKSMATASKQSNSMQATENVKQESTKAVEKLGSKPIPPVIDNVVKTVEKIIDSKETRESEKPKLNNLVEKQVTLSVAKITENGIKATKNTETTGNAKNDIIDKVITPTKQPTESKTTKQTNDTKTTKQTNDKSATEYAKQEINNMVEKTSSKLIPQIVEKILTPAKSATDNKIAGNVKLPVIGK